jgi:YVTN family beta-propeller protein
MLKVNNLVYVANSGGFDKDNTVKVIDSNTDAIVSTITVGDNPNSLQRDKDGNIWVSSGGAIAFDANFNIDVANSTKGSISKINSSNTETLRLSVDKVTYSAPSSLSIDSMATSATALPTAAFKNESYYGLSVDPINGNVLGFKAPNFSSAGTMEILTQTGSLVKTYTVGIGPNGCAFK